jgi:hypothetical protein
MAGLLPVSLKRFSWKVSAGNLPPNLSHLTQVSFLQLDAWPCFSLEREVLPPCLQELQLLGPELEVPEEQQQVVTRWQPAELCSDNTQQQLQRLTNLTTADVALYYLKTPAARAAAVAQLTKVSALHVHGGIGSLGPYVQPALTAAGGLHALRRLHLDLDLDLDLNGVSALTGVTQLVLSVPGGDGLSPASSALAAEVSTLSGLKWLSVPDVLLRAEVGWLGGLQQLRVLVLQCQGKPAAADSGPYADAVPWLEAGLQAAPSSLQVLCWSGVPAKQAAAWQLRRRLQQALGNSGCEVVVGVDLDEAAEPTQQLAGLPVSLQQALV